MKIIPVLAVLTIALGAVASAPAQTYPSKPVRMIVGFSPGSATDVLARMVSQKLTEAWSQQVLVDNRTGAGGSVGTGIVAKAPATGYTLLFHSSAFATNAALYQNLSYNPQRDFVAISSVVSQPFVIVAGASAGVRTVTELIRAAKARPGQINYGSAGLGSGTHLAAEKFRLEAGIDVVHVPYRGGPEATADTIAGRVTFWFPPVGIAAPYIRDGRLLALGVTSARRSDLLLEVPTLSEAGLPGFDYTNWWGIWAPAGIPAELVGKLAKDIARAQAAPDLRGQFTKFGSEPMIMIPAEFARFVRGEIDDTVRIVKAAGIKPQ
ncbi:MAG TPA: tripartite tricarboxylate transporter substrate binding protein [Burkholderiales bacterium]|jgi:tripartite-type tricarboxylate transporter receptor subunit TctC